MLQRLCDEGEQEATPTVPLKAPKMASDKDTEADPSRQGQPDPSQQPSEMNIRHHKNLGKGPAVSSPLAGFTNVYPRTEEIKSAPPPRSTARKWVKLQHVGQ